MNTVKPVLSCIYFRSDRNPECEQTDKYTQKVAHTFSGYEFVEIDTEKVELARKYYQVRAEPEYVICCLGQPILRHIGDDQVSLEAKLQKVADFYKECNFPEGTSNYEEFHEQFIAEYQDYEKQQDHWYK